MGIAVVGFLVLLLIAIIAVPIIIRVIGEAAGRNQNRPGGEGEGRDEESERD